MARGQGNSSINPLFGPRTAILTELTVPREPSVEFIEKEQIGSSGLNFQHGIDYDEQGESDCEASGCGDEGICRCYTIESVTIDNVSHGAIAKEIYDHYIENHARAWKVRAYSYDPFQRLEVLNLNIKDVEDIVSQHDITTHDFRIDYGRSYYGDELHGIYMSDDIHSDIDRKVRKLIKD